MAETSSRVRWDSDERARVAAAMAIRMQQSPDMPLLAVLRDSQEGLAEDRRRQFKAWSVAQPILQEALDEALAALQLTGPAATPHPAHAAPSAPEQAPDAVRASPHDGVPSGTSVLEAGVLPDEAAAPAAGVVAASAPTRILESQSPVEATGQLESQPHPPQADAPGDRKEPISPAKPVFDPLMVEAALQAALLSPVVEDMLTDLFGRALARALVKVQQPEAEASHAAPGADSEPTGLRVLLAGFAAQQIRGLEDALRPSFEVRVWKLGQTMQLFQSLAGICRVAVVPESAGEDVDDALRGFGIKVMRHEGSPAKLAERLGELAVL